MSSNIKIGDMAKEIKTIFTQFEHSVKADVDKAADIVAKEAVKKLKETSPKGKSKKKYKNSWRVQKKGGTAIVHNEQYQLTHLLENGHDIVINGEVRGHAAPHPHIAPVEEWVQDEFPKEFERQVSK